MSKLIINWVSKGINCKKTCFIDSCLYNYCCRKPFGKEISATFVNKLMEKRDSGLYYFHPDYCGIGIFYDKNNKIFYISEVEDGKRSDDIKTFHNENVLINWLSNQSNWTMSGASYNSDHLKVKPNQTITLYRLIKFIN